MQYAKRHNLRSKHYKVIIGITGELQRAVGVTREACQKYSEARRNEEAKYRTHKQLGINQTGRGFKLWLEKMTKVSMQVGFLCQKKIQSQQEQGSYRRHY